MKKLVAIACLSLVASCGADPEKASRVLKSQGMSDIHIGGFAFYGCGNDDDYGSFFTAKGAQGQDVSGVICGGWLKGYTVRFD